MYRSLRFNGKYVNQGTKGKIYCYTKSQQITLQVRTTNMQPHICLKMKMMALKTRQIYSHTYVSK
jgi:hypothetical protein